MRDTMEQGAQVDFPVDDGTYNLMTTLTEKLQALDTYRIYAEDVEGPELELYQELIDQDTRHAQRIWEVLKERISRS
jgi:rubrerythrin